MNSILIIIIANIGKETLVPLPVPLACHVIPMKVIIPQSIQHVSRRQFHLTQSSLPLPIAIERKILALWHR